jgi:hypothetical protein
MKSLIEAVEEGASAIAWPARWRKNDYPNWAYEGTGAVELQLGERDVLVVNPLSDDDAADLADWMTGKDARTYIVPHPTEGRRHLVRFAAISDAVTFRLHFGGLTRSWRA